MSLRLFSNGWLARTVAYNLSASNLHTSCALWRTNDWKRQRKSIVIPDEGTKGETSVVLDAAINKHSIFPDESLPNRVFNGIKFKDLPIVNIKTTPNNTIITVTDSKGTVRSIWSCGCEGFKNTRKGTNIAAQATATTVAVRALERGIRNVRVTIQGLGPGRASSIKGLQLAGMNIISITDATRVSWNPPRPRKARRV